MAAPASEIHFGPIRRVVVFILGIGIVLDALASQGANIPELVIGAVLLGIIPVDQFLGAWTEHWHSLTRGGSAPSTPDRESPRGPVD